MWLVSRMESTRLLRFMSADFQRLREVAAKDLSAPVPSCPGWLVADLVRHVGFVYLHKVEAMRQGRAPEPWPPNGVEGAEPLAVLDDAWSRLVAEFGSREPAAGTYTWYEPDQTVGFWVRRMAQETVIHRIDAELAMASAVQPVPAELALDGIDEVLVVFLAYATGLWCEDFGEDLARADARPVLLSTGGSGWLVRACPDGVSVEPGLGAGPVPAAATIRAEPESMLRWLWGRGGNGVAVEGDPELVAQLRRLLVIATQ
jgi:uncharacterized protein (TIGR03083 family)